MNKSRERRKYLAMMLEIDRRLEVIEEFIAGHANAIYRQTSIECQALQLRKILELIAFSSLLSNRNAYEQVRADIRKDWHAERILRKIASINPDFYPVPVTGHSGVLRRIRHSFLTRSQFAKLYDRCGDMLHARNPFSRASDRSLAFESTIAESVQRIRALMEEHVVKLAKSTNWLYVMFPNEPHGPFTAHYYSGCSSIFSGVVQLERGKGLPRGTHRLLS